MIAKHNRTPLTHIQQLSNKSQIEVKIKVLSSILLVWEAATNNSYKIVAIVVAAETPITSIKYWIT